jgi:hypothetical protein
MIAKSSFVPPRNSYPTRDGKPIAETDLHRDVMSDMIEMLKRFYAHNEFVYVSGNLLKTRIARFA